MKNIGRRTFLGMLGAAPILASRLVWSVQPEASVIFTNGKILTVDGSDSVAEAVAIRGDRILAVGTSPQIRTFAHRGTIHYDLQGKTVTPGLIDAHAHLPPFGSRELLWVNLQGIVPKQAILEQISLRAEKTPEGEFIYAWGVESNDLAFMDRNDLDAVTTRHPVLVVHTTGQWGFANSAALKLSGITHATTSPPGSVVQKGMTGQPTGLLVHYPALYLVRKSMPRPAGGQMNATVGHAAGLYSREGVTSIHDNFFMVTGVSGFESPARYFELAASGRLPVRLKIWPYLPTLDDTRDAVTELFGTAKPSGTSPFAELAGIRRADPAAFARVWGGLKIAVDGSGPTAAWQRNPRSLMLHSRQDLNAMVALIHAARQQVSVHAAGDDAVVQILDAIEAARKTDGRPDPRHRIEHAMLPESGSFRRIRKAGVVISTHPQFIYAWGDPWMHPRRDWFIPLRSFVNNEIPVALGADPPAFPFWQPQYALWQATARVTRQGSPFSQGQSVTFRQACACTPWAGPMPRSRNGTSDRWRRANLQIWPSGTATSWLRGPTRSAMQRRS